MSDLNALRLKKAAVELWRWQLHGAENSCFSAQLFRLIHKADPCNLERISMGFPEEVAVYREWFESQTPELFYARYGLISRRQRL